MKTSIPASSSYKTTVAKVIYLAADLRQNREALSKLLSRAIDLCARKHNLWLGIGFGARRGSWRLVFIDPSNLQCLWRKDGTLELAWFPMTGSRPSIF